MAFLRRRSAGDEPERDDDVPLTDDEAAELDDEDGEVDQPEVGREDEPRQTTGPYDISEVENPAEGRIDLGSLLIPSRDGMELRVEVDEASGQMVAVTLVVDDSALQLAPFAAPRSSGIWEQVRIELRGSVASQGGTADEVDGPFGLELWARMPVRAADGSPGIQRVRFIGVDGPRWFLRGVLSGAAAERPHATSAMEDLFREVVVVRGGNPMAPRELIPIRLPDSAATGEAAEAVDPLNPFRRGPEITEVR